jgi:ABC-type Zn uptake system ZnuABC Zn-binding protein ZnuA
VLASGGDVDAWLGDLVKQADGDAERATLADEIGADSEDPHWWQDPANAAFAVQRIGQLFAKRDPDATDAYTASAKRYAAKINALDERIESCMSSVADDKRTLVTSHDAFGWFARRYDIEVLGSVIPGRSTSAQPSAGDVRELVAAIRREGVRTIFPESALNPRLEQAIARDAGAKVGPALYADTLGPSGTYLGALRHDAAAMAAGFGAKCRL